MRWPGIFQKNAVQYALDLVSGINSAGKDGRLIVGAGLMFFHLYPD